MGTTAVSGTTTAIPRVIPGTYTVFVSNASDFNQNYNRDRQETYDQTAVEDRRPILLDLDGDGIEITGLDRSTTLDDSADDGLMHRTAWAGAGDGVSFFDADGMVSGRREYVFTEWDATGRDDMAALRSQFDSTKDGRLTALGAEWTGFKVRGAPTFVSATAAHTLAAGRRRGLVGTAFPLHRRRKSRSLARQYQRFSIMGSFKKS